MCDVYLSDGVWTSSLCPDIMVTSESAELECMFPQEEPLDTGPSTKTAWSRRAIRHIRHIRHIRGVDGLLDPSPTGLPG